MEVRQEDICIVERFRITEYQFIEKGEVKETLFNIRNEQGKVYSRSFGRIQDPLLMLLGLTS